MKNKCLCEMCCYGYKFGGIGKGKWYCMRLGKFVEDVKECKCAELIVISEDEDEKN